MAILNVHRQHNLSVFITSDKPIALHGDIIVVIFMCQYMITVQMQKQWKYHSQQDHLFILEPQVKITHSL